MKFFLVFWSVFLAFAFSAEAEQNGKHLKDKIGKSAQIKNNDIVLNTVPIIVREKAGKDGKQKACAIIYDQNTGEEHRCCSVISKDEKGDLRVEPNENNHCLHDRPFFNESVQSGGVKPEGSVTTKSLSTPGVCSDYHGVGQPICGVQNNGNLTYAWCKASADPADYFYHAEIYFGATGLLHVGNIMDVPSGKCPGT